MIKRDIGAEIIAGLKELRDNPEGLKRYEVTARDAKALREKLGMSVSEFAERIGVTPSDVEKLEGPVQSE